MPRQTKYYRNQSFPDWISSLSKNGFFKSERVVGRTTYSLNTPLQIILKQEVVERIKKRYNPNYEIGGILLAEPTLIGDEKVLSINHVRFIENLSKNDRASPLKYRAKGNQRSHIDKCLRGRKDNIRYIPIWFHSHPRQETNNISEYLITFFNMSTSEGDKKSATRMIIYEMQTEKNYEVTFKFPSALVIVSKENYFFIGVYGGLIAPDDFRGYIQRLLNQTTKDLINWVDSSDSFWGKIAGIIGAIGTGFLSIESNNPIYRALAAQAAIAIKDQKTDHNYFSFSKNNEVKILLPPFNSE